MTKNSNKMMMTSNLTCQGHKLERCNFKLRVDHQCQLQVKAIFKLLT